MATGPGSGLDVHAPRPPVRAGMTHVGPVHHPPVAEAEGEPISLALDAHAPVVQDVVVDAADCDEVPLGVVASGAEALDVMQVQPEAIAAAFFSPHPPPGAAPAPPRWGGEPGT